MGFWNWSRRRKSGQALAVRAKFDSAQTTADNRKHWANADYLSANSAATPEVRRVLRSRARYEVANNSYAKGIILTLANDAIGTGPRLQMLTEDSELNQRIERWFASWSKSIRLAEKLRTMRMARAQDGEAFGLLTTNRRIAGPVQLDLQLFEADRCTTPDLAALTNNAVDGIVFDPSGNPIEYHILRYHPGDLSSMGFGLEYDRIPSGRVIHWFRADRPGQSRGLPDIMPALPLFAQLRRYTLAVIAAAESAANIAVLMKTNTPAGGEAAEVEPMSEMEFAANMGVFVPEGWEPSQIKAEQPATTYEMFKREILNEIARCLNIPFNVAAGNSSGYNYASGRLDHQTYYKSLRVERSEMEGTILDPILAEGLREASISDRSMSLDDAPHQWFWDGTEHVDPAKEATAQATRLTSNTTTLAAEYARQGKDWETELRQRAKEVALMKELGLSSAQPAMQSEPTVVPDDDGEDDDEEAQSKDRYGEAA